MMLAIVICSGMFFVVVVCFVFLFVCFVVVVFLGGGYIGKIVNISKTNPYLGMSFVPKYNKSDWERF